MPSIPSHATITWFDQKPSHCPVARNVTQAQHDEEVAYRHVDELADQVAFLRIVGASDGEMAEAYQAHNNAVKAAKAASKRLHAIERKTENG